MNLREVRDSAERCNDWKFRDVYNDSQTMAKHILATIDPEPDAITTVDWIQSKYAGQAFEDEFAFSDHFHRWKNGELWQGKYVRTPAKTRQQFCDLAKALGLTRKDGAK